MPVALAPRASPLGRLQATTKCSSSRSIHASGSGCSRSCASDRVDAGGQRRGAANHDRGYEVRLLDVWRQLVGGDVVYIMSLRCL